MYLPLTKGLAIYRQNHTKSVYIRLRIEGKEIKRSLKTSDVEEAKTRAWQLKFEYEGKVKAGISIQANKVLSINDACRSIVEQLKEKKPFKSVYKDYIRNYEQYIIPYFKRCSIEDLTSKKIRLYFESQSFSKTTLTTNRTCFNKIFSYLEEEELLKRKDFPSLPKDIKTIKNNIGVDIKEEDLSKIEDFITSEEWLNQPNINYKTKEYREIFPYVFKLLLETGIRTGEEMNNLKYSDIEKHEGNLYIRIRKGKTKDYNQREVLLNKEAIRSILEIAEITTKNEVTKNDLFKIKDRYIFESSFGKIADWCKLFDNAIKKLSTIHNLKHKYTLYSCRHTYITKQLLRGIDMYILAKQVGNSLEMIQKHYDHVQLRDSKNANKLLRGKRGMQVIF